MGPNGERIILFPTNPDLVGILGRLDSDFAKWIFEDSFVYGFPDFQLPGRGILRYKLDSGKFSCKVKMIIFQNDHF